MSAVIALHPDPRHQLAAYLHGLADAIDAGLADVEPHGVLLCLTGASRHEAMWHGYDADAGGFADALDALPRIVCAPFPHLGRIRARRARGGHRPVPSCSLSLKSQE